MPRFAPGHVVLHTSFELDELQVLEISEIVLRSQHLMRECNIANRLPYDLVV